MAGQYFFYILRCKDGSLYSGITQDLEKRERLHNTGKGSAYVRSRGGGVVVYSEIYKTKGEALKRESEVKKWPKVKKEDFILAKKGSE